MNLLVFAHIGEAQCFLTDAQKIAHPKLKLWKVGRDLLLVTGEGGGAVSFAVSCVLCFEPRIRQILNYGVAGSLKTNLNIGSVVDVHVSYQFYGGENFEHRSHVLAGVQSGVFCVTSSKRVLEADLKNYLSYFGDIVDRELWSIGYIASRFGIPVSSKKLVVDFADGKINCEHIVSQSKRYSHELFLYHRDKVEESTKSTNTSEKPKQTLLNLSQAQNSEFRKLKKSMVAQFGEEYFQQFMERNVDEKQAAKNPKQFNKKFLQEMQMTAYPELFSAKEELIKNLKPLKEAGFQVDFDQRLEHNWFRIQCKINSQKDIASLVDGLQSFDYKKWSEKFQGISNV